ncbi:hypothetical protein [Verrucosispora sp. WMMD1129]|uniref:hypothetical protein n=1 Tax=Verrucosispora sp. WMMD1129 TaxID=3016093 RepID=UPI00249A35BC|nr:hypothetical protein [Verrucosispora sp. WMMD1129]WFE47686.1 hypothetical protein O7624_26835 [Verrucosispora sp. WMMD1129]
MLSAGLESALPESQRSAIWSGFNGPVDSSEASESRRAFISLDWLIRSWTPQWTRYVDGVGEELAVKLEGLPPIVDLPTAETAGNFVGVLESIPAEAEKTIAKYKGNAYDEAAAAAAREAASRVCAESAGSAVANAAASTNLDACMAARTDVALAGVTAIALLASLDGVAPYIRHWASGPGDAEAKIISVQALAPHAAWRSLSPTAESLQQSALQLHRRLAMLG